MGAISKLFLKIFLIVVIIFVSVYCMADEANLFYYKKLKVNSSFYVNYFSSSRSLDDEHNFIGTGLESNVNLQINPKFSFYSKVRVFTKDLFLSREDIDGEVQEGYLNIYLNNCDIQLGKQIISWGRTDRINPTDNLTPWNYTLLFPKDSDIRSGIAAIKINYYVKDITITAIGIPFFESSTIPLPRIPQPFIIQQTPSHSLKNSEYALKIDMSGGSIDWSVSYFNGFDLLPDLRLFNIKPSLITLTFKYPQIQVVGGDVATVVGKIGLRGEIAYFFTEDSIGDIPEKKNPYLFYVIGVDRTFEEYLNINLQFIQRIISHFKNPESISDPIIRIVAIEGAVLNNQLERIINQFSLRIGHKCFHETLESEVSIIYDITRKDYFITPKITYAISDHWKIALGADIFQGTQKSFYGRLKKNSAFYLELKSSF